VTEGTVKTRSERALDKAATTLGAALLKASIEQIKQLREPWHKTAEADQQRVINNLRLVLDVEVRRAALSIAGAGFVSFPMTLDGLGIKDGLKAALSCPLPDEGLETLARHSNKIVQLVLADSDEYTNGMDAIQADKDQPELPLTPPNETPQEVKDALQAISDDEARSAPPLADTGPLEPESAGTPDL